MIRSNGQTVSAAMKSLMVEVDEVARMQGSGEAVREGREGAIEREKN